MGEFGSFLLILLIGAGSFGLGLLFYHLDTEAVKKGNYLFSRYGKVSIWGFIGYFFFLIFLICFAALFGILG